MNLAGVFPAQSVSTVIIQSDGVSSEKLYMTPLLKQSVKDFFPKLPGFEELIIAESVPAFYLQALKDDKLQRMRSNIRYLTLYAYSEYRDVFERPCDHLPELEELRLELMDLEHIKLESCTKLQKVVIQGYHSFTAVKVDNVSIFQGIFSF